MRRFAANRLEEGTCVPAVAGFKSDIEGHYVGPSDAKQVDSLAGTLGLGGDNAVAAFEMLAEYIAGRWGTVGRIKRVLTSMLLRFARSVPVPQVSDALIGKQI